MLKMNFTSWCPKVIVFAHGEGRGAYFWFIALATPYPIILRESGTKSLGLSSMHSMGIFYGQSFELEYISVL